MSCYAENNLENDGENAGYLRFLFLPQCFQSFLSQDGLKLGIVW